MCIRDRHGILALAEDDDVTDTLNALERVAYIEVEIIADEEVVVLTFIGVEAGGKNEGAGVLGNGDAGGLHFRRQATEGAGGAVLDVDGSDVEIAIEVEGRGDAAGAIVAAGGAEVAHAFRAVDGLLKKSGNAALDGERVGAVVERADRDLRRRELRELR